MAHRTAFSYVVVAAISLSSPFLLHLRGVAAVASDDQSACSVSGDAASGCSAEHRSLGEAVEDYTSFLAGNHLIKAHRRQSVEPRLDVADVSERDSLVAQLKQCLQSEKGGLGGAVPSEVVYAFGDALPAESERWALHNQRIADKMTPLAVVFAKSSEEVVQALSCAVSLQILVSGQSGRHSYVPYCESTCLLVNVQGLQAVNVNAAKRTAVLGVGLNLGQVYAMLADHGFTIPSGTCPSVGLGGNVLGGGMGILNRMYGLAIDQLSGLDVVLPNGSFTHANATHDADLFWLARGGGGAVFPGVATGYHFNLVALPPVLTEYLAKWQMPCNGTDCKSVGLDATMSASIIRMWQQYYMSHPDRRVHVVLDFHPLSEAPGEGPYISLAFKFVGMKQSDAEPLLQPAWDALKDYTHTGTWSTSSYIKKIALDAGVGSMPPGEPCKSLEDGLTEEDIRQEMMKSEPPFCYPSGGFDLGQKYRAIVTSTLSEQSIEKLSQWMVQAPKFALPDDQFWIFDIQLEPTNGHTADVGQAATAFPWRIEDAFTLQVVSMWTLQFENSTTRAILEVLSYSMIKSLQPLLGSKSYVNYADESMPGGVDPLDAYFGPNKAEVLRIASQYGAPISS